MFYFLCGCVGLMGRIDSGLAASGIEAWKAWKACAGPSLGD